MKKFIKISVKVILILLVGLLLFLLAFQLPAVQSFATRKVLDKLEESTNAEISFSSIRLKPFNAISINDLLIIDTDPPIVAGAPVDTFLSAAGVNATFSLAGLFKKEGFHIRKVEVNDGSFVLVNSPEGMNVKRIFNLPPKDPDKEKKELGDVFDLRRASVRNFRFRMVNTKKPPRKKKASTGRRPSTDEVPHIDWADLDLTADLKVRNVRMSDGRIYGFIEDARIREKSGYTVTGLNGSVKFGDGKTVVDGLHLTDLWSDIYIDPFVMHHPDKESFKDFIRQVKLEGEISRSRVDFRSLSYFAPTLYGNPLIVDLNSASVSGPVAALSIKDFRFSEKSSGLNGGVNGTLAGLPDIKKFRIDASLKDIRFDSRGLGDFISAWTYGKKLDFGKIAPGQGLVFNGSGNGLLDSLFVRGVVSAGENGKAEAEALLRHIVNPAPITIKGRLAADGLELGKFTGNPALGQCTARTYADLVLGSGNTSARIDTLVVDKLSLNGYDYSSLTATGTYSGQAFDGRVICTDPNLNFLAQGTFNLSRKTNNALYKFYATIGYADLNALNIDHRGTSRISAGVNANYKVLDRKDAIGSFGITDLILTDSYGRHDIGNISIVSHSNDDIKRLNFSSKFADGKYAGTKFLSDFVKDLQRVTAVRELPSLYKELPAEQEGGQEYTLQVDFHDSRDILSFINRGLYIADSTSVSLTLGKDDDLFLSVVSPRLASGANYLKDVVFEAENTNGSVEGRLSSSELSLSSLTLKDNELILYAADDHIGVGYIYDNGTETDNRGEIYLSGDISRTPEGEFRLDGKMLPSNIYYNDNAWAIAPAAITMQGSHLDIDSFSVSCDEQSIFLAGGLSPDVSDTLSLRLDKFDLGVLNTILGNGYDIKGTASGGARIISPTGDVLALIADLVCDSLYFAGERVGTLTLESHFDDDDSSFRFSGFNDLDSRRNIDITGRVVPQSGDLSVKMSLNEVDATYAEPFLKSLFSGLDGGVSGDIFLENGKDGLSISSRNASFNDVRLVLDFTKVPYTVSGPFHLDDYGLHFDEVTIRDGDDGTADLRGSVTFDHLKDLGTDLSIDLKSIQALKTGIGDNDSFYGNIYANGLVRVTGPVNDILVDIDASTTKRGELHIPLAKASNAGHSDLLTFKEMPVEVYIDPYDLMMNRMQDVSRKGNSLVARLNVRVHPGVQGYIDIDKENTSSVTANGTGTIGISVDNNNNLSLSGDYNVNSGSVHYNALGITSRNFSINNGSTIRFNGDVMDTELDIDAAYTTKTSLSALIADTTSLAGRKTVVCGIKITDKLNNPSLQFSIDVPDVDPTVAARVESALNSEDKIQRQFISLLLTNNFLPDEQSGITNNSGLFPGNMAELMANQLNTILQEFDIPVDFGLKYEATENGNDIFDVAISTQLFNNRVVVNGALGNKQYAMAGATGEMAGDLDIEIKLNRRGNLRLNIFSHSADDYTNILDNSQRNGAGIAYSSEFDTFKEFFTNLFHRRRRRSEGGPRSQPAREERGKVEIIIDGNEGR